MLRAIAKSQVGDRGPPFKCASFPADIEKDIADYIFGEHLIPHDAQDEPVRSHLMSSK